MSEVGDAVLVQRFRRALLVLAAIACGGTAVELAMLRHWNGVEQLVPWATLALVAVGIAVVARSDAPRAVGAGRVIGVTAGLAGLFGVYEHIASNYEVGPLDFRYADRWATMSVPARLWAAATGEVGPSPALAPAILALAGTMLMLATLGTNLRRRSRPDIPDRSTTVRGSLVTPLGEGHVPMSDWRTANGGGRTAGITPERPGGGRT